MKLLWLYMWVYERRYKFHVHLMGSFVPSCTITSCISSIRHCPQMVATQLKALSEMVATQSETLSKINATLK